MESVSIAAISSRTETVKSGLVALLSATSVHISQRRASSRPSEKCNASCIMAETRSFKDLLDSDARAALHRTRSVPAPRKSKHAPRELSAHFPVSRFKRISFGSKRRETPRDPRFQRYAGHFNQGFFEQSYGFIGSYMQNEVADLKAALKDERNPEARESLQRTLNRKKEALRRREDRNLMQEAKKQLKDQERHMVQQGKAPFFAKRRVIRMTAMKLRLDKLQAEGQVEHYEARKRKRSHQKEKMERLKMARTS